MTLGTQPVKIVIMSKHYHLCHTTNGAHPWQLHKADCKDVYRMFQGLTPIKLNSRPERMQGTTPEAVVEEMLGSADNEGDLREMGWSEADIRIMPCCKDATDVLPTVKGRFRLK